MLATSCKDSTMEYTKEKETRLFGIKCLARGHVSMQTERVGQDQQLYNYWILFLLTSSSYNLLGGGVLFAEVAEDNMSAVQQTCCHKSTCLLICDSNNQI